MKKYLSALIVTAFLGFGCCEPDESGNVTSPFLEFFKDKGPIVYLNIPDGGYKYPEVPEKYKDKHMPDGWWTDPKIIELGKRVYEGIELSDVACKTCHGSDAVPLMTGARDFRDPAFFEKASDSFLFWRVMEGVVDTPMAAWGLDYGMNEDQVWAVIAYANTFHNGGEAKEHVNPAPQQ